MSACPSGTVMRFTVTGCENAAGGAPALVTVTPAMPELTHGTVTSTCVLVAAEINAGTPRIATFMLPGDVSNPDPRIVAVPPGVSVAGEMLVISAGAFCTSNGVEPD